MALRRESGVFLTERARLSELLLDLLDRKLLLEADMWLLRERSD